MSQAEVQVAYVSDLPIMLAPGQIACGVCGVAVLVVPDLATFVVEAMAREGDPPAAPGAPLRPGMVTQFARCAPCEDRLDAAHALLDAHPGVQAAVGSREIAEHRVESGLAALAVLGHDLGGEVSAEVLASLLRNLSGPGSAVRWSSRFAPLVRAGARAETANPYPFAHVQDDLRATLREGYAALLRDKVATGAAPVSVTVPPPAAACAFCGVASVLVPASMVSRLGGLAGARREFWQIVDTTTDSLGGSPSPDRIQAALCQPCGDAVRSVGSVGETARERAFIEHLRSAGKEREVELMLSGEVSGVVGFGALPPGTSPNETPWQHLSWPDPEQ